MGCNISRPPESQGPHNKKRYTAKVHNSQLQIDPMSETLQRYEGEQQVNQMGTSPSLLHAVETPEKRFQHSKSIRSQSPQRLEIVPNLMLPSNDPSLSDVKGSLEASFDRDNKDKEGSHGGQPKSPNRSDPNYFKIRGSTPSFAKPSGFKMGTSNRENPPENVVKVPDNLTWSLAPLKDGIISPAESGELREKEPKFGMSDKAGSEKVSREYKDQTEVSSKLEDSMEEKIRKKETIRDLKEFAREGRSTTPPENTRTVKELNMSKESKDGSNAIKFQHIHRKFQKILLTDSAPVTTTNLPMFGSPVVSANTSGHPSPGLGFDVERSPPKTLNFLDVPFANDSHTKKSLVDFHDHSILSNSTTNINSIGTISNLVSLCKDDKKKGTFEKKFRTNLVDLIKDKSKEELPEIRKPDYIRRQSINSNKEPARRFSIDKYANNYMLKSALTNNLLGLVREEENRGHQKHKSLQMNSEDVFEDLIGPSPNNKVQQSSLSGKHFLPPLPWVGGLNNSVRLTDTSAINQDKTICNFEEGVSRLEWDKYSICEQINNVEIDERSYLDVGSLTRIEGLESQTPINLNTSALGTVILEDKLTEVNLVKTKSAPFNEAIKTNENESLNQLRSQPSYMKVNNNLNESISTIQYLSPIQGPRALTVTPSRPKRLMKYARGDSQVIETNRVDKSVDEEGQKKINQYILIKEVGRGGYGKVKLSINTETKKQVAIKVANKKKLKRKLLSRQKSAFNQLASEIAIMKKIDHPNVVKLYEVIDDPNNDKLYLVMEYIKRGAVMSRNYWRQSTKSKDIGNENGIGNKNFTLSEEKAKKYFRHLALSLDYMHNYAEIVHRDIKPENLLISEDDVLKVSDFGISAIVEQGNDKLDDNAGTKYYLAPEAWEAKSFHGKPADIWAAGGTLYFFLVGKPPFNGKDAAELKERINEEELKFPEDLNLNPKVVELIKNCLVKNPLQRYTIEEIMQDPWLTDDGKNPVDNEGCIKPEVNDDELEKAFSKVKFMAAIMVTAKLKKNLTITRRNLERKKTQDASQLAQLQERFG